LNSLPFSFLKKNKGERERKRWKERGTRRNFVDRQISVGQLGLKGPPRRIWHDTLRITPPSRPPSLNVSFFLSRSQIQLFSLPLSLSLSLSLSSKSFYGCSSLIFWIIFPRVVCRVETLEMGRKKKRDSYGRESPYATHIPQLKYIGDDNTTVATEKDRRMLCRRRNKETRNIPYACFYLCRRI